MTRALASQGATVYVCDIAKSAPELEKLDNVHFTGALDIVKRQECKSFLDGIPGRLDGLVNCAGVCLSEGRMASDEVFTRTFEINTRGTWNIGTEGILRMSEQEPRKSAPDLLPEFPRTPGAGRIVNFASGAGLRGIANLAAYCGSKHAVVGMTRAWAKDWPSLRINAVAPGKSFMWFI